MQNPGLLTKVIIKGQNLIVPNGVEIYIPGATLMLESTNGAYDNGSILVEGKLEAVIEFLGGYGEVSQELRDKIMEQKDVEIAARWIKLAASVSSVEEFEKRMEG